VGVMGGFFSSELFDFRPDFSADLLPQGSAHGAAS
jgi:hypothetical protein